MAHRPCWMGACMTRQDSPSLGWAANDRLGRLYNGTVNCSSLLCPTLEQDQDWTHLDSLSIR